MNLLKHIVIDGRFLRRSTGGIGRYTQALIRELINLANPYRYTVLLRPADQADWTNLVEPLKVDTNQWQTHVVDIPHYSWAEQTKLIQVLRGLKPDLVHFTNFNHPIRWREPFVVTIHDLTILKYPVGTRQASKVFQWAFRQNLRHAAAASRKVITVSETSKNDLVGLLRLPPAKVAVTYEGVDKVFQPVNLPLRGRGQRRLAEKLHLRPPYLLFVSQWRPHKGLPILIEAYNLFRTANPRLKPQLVVVGQPNADYPEILATIEKSPYAEDIIRPGFISELDLVHLYQTAEAFVFPSLYEGFGLPPLEAMATGTPVIASATSCLPEILGEAARLVPANDSSALAVALAEVTTNRLLWRQLRAAGLTRVRQFSWRKMGQETLAIYEAALE